MAFQNPSGQNFSGHLFFSLLTLKGANFDWRLHCISVPQEGNFRIGKKRAAYIGRASNHHFLKTAIWASTASPNTARFFCPCRAKDCGGKWWWKIRHFWRQAIMGCSADAFVACAGIPVRGYMYRLQRWQKINVNFVKQQPPGLACCC